jgi:plasmid stabilization system protein ParE
MESFRFSEPAQRDFDELLRFVARQDGSARARVVRGEILAAAALLARMPGMGHARDDVPSTMRTWTVHRWLILYRPEAIPLEIVRIVGGWQDLPTRLGDPDLD